MLTYVMLTVYDDATPTSARVSPAADKEDFMYEPPSHGCGVAGPPSRDYSFRESGYGVAGTIGNRTKRLVKWPMQLTTQARLENTGAKAFVQLAHRLTRIARVTLRNPQSAVRNPQWVAAGNLTKDATHYCYWDYENRLTKVKLVADSTDVAEYTYDALNRRIEKIDERGETDVTTRFIYAACPAETRADIGWSVIEERDGSGTLQAEYVHGPRIDEYLTMTRSGATYWYMQSAIVGNVAALVDSSGAIQEGYLYTAYGTATVHTDPGNDATWFTADDTTATTSALDNPYTFTGRRLDNETAVMYSETGCSIQKPAASSSTIRSATRTG